MRFARERFFLLIFAFAACSAALGAEHHGFVKFGGLPVPGATVMATQGDKRFSAITDLQGAYSFADLADGAWTIRVEMLCFEPSERDVPVAAGAPAPEWELKVLPFEAIQASAVPAEPLEPPPTATAKPAAAAAQKKARRAPEAQPANTSSAFQRADLNASQDAASAADIGPGTPAEITETPSDGFLINGSINNGAASPFAQSRAFGNFRARRSLYNGALGLTLNNSVWDARSFSLTGQNTAKPGYTRAQVVGSFGGPLKIPGILPHNGPYVTVNFEFVRNRNASLSTSRVPTDAERRGDLSGQSIVLKDPATGLPLAGNIIPDGRISPQARALLALYPRPNFTGSDLYNYQVPLVGSTHQDSVQARTSKYINQKNSVAGQFALQNARSDSSNLFGFLDTTRSQGVTASVTWTRRITNRLPLNVTYQFSRMATRVRPYFADLRNLSGEAGISGNNQQPANWGPPSLAFSNGIAALTDAQNSATRDQSGAVTGSMTWSRGSHNLKIGGEYRRQQWNQLAQQNPRGTFTFTGEAAGGDFAGFLLGIPDASSIAYGNADKYFRASSYNGYLTDDWRMAASLTVTAGLRWDYSAPVTERYGRLVNLDIAPGFSAVAPVIAAAPAGSVTRIEYPDALLRPDKRAFQPRVGIAWRPFLASSVVIRAGYGVYYDPSVYMSIASRMAQQPPLSVSLSVRNSAANPLTLADGFKTAPDSTANTFAVDPNFRRGYAQNWQVSIQRDLPGGLVASATYLGIKGTRGQQQFLPNTYPAGSSSPCPTCPTGYIYLTSNGNSSRHSGQFQLRRRLRSGFAAQLSYTFSKAIDDAAMGSGGQTVIAQDWRNLHAERGLSSFDQRHVLSVETQYTTGMGLRGGTLVGGWKGGLFKDWTFASQIASGSGLPLTPSYPAAVRGTGVTGSIRPDYTGAPLYDAPPGFFLNPASVAPPAAGRWGNAGRNSITGPARFSLNASMGRTFRLSDRLSADFRLDMANALNHVVFSSWNTVSTSPQFGLPGAANPMRSVQAAIRVRF
jgi:hypothetical protein